MPNINYEIPEITKAIKVVETLLNVKLGGKCKKRYIFYARVIYVSLIKDKGYSLNQIGAPIGKDHATILYYYAQFEQIFKTDASFRINYKKCYDVFTNAENDTYYKDAKNEILSLNITLDCIKKEKELLALENKRNERLKEMIEILRVRVPHGKEEFVCQKLNVMLNGINFKKD